MNQVYKPNHFVLHGCFEVNVSAVDGESSLKIVGCYKRSLHHVRTEVTIRFFLVILAVIGSIPSLSIRPPSPAPQALAPARAHPGHHPELQTGQQVTSSHPGSCLSWCHQSDSPLGIKPPGPDCWRCDGNFLIELSRMRHAGIIF